MFCVLFVENDGGGVVIGWDDVVGLVGGIVVVVVVFCIGLCECGGG